MMDTNNVSTWQLNRTSAPLRAVAFHKVLIADVATSCEETLVYPHAVPMRLIAMRESRNLRMSACTLQDCLLPPVAEGNLEVCRPTFGGFAILALLSTSWVPHVDTLKSLHKR